MHIPDKNKKNKGQHAIEYTVLLTLIMAAIIIIGPYVVRSWNANLKGWDDSVMDSIQDPLLEVPPSGANITGCNADPETNEGCGLQIFDVCTDTMIFCGPLEMLVSQKYTPPGCRCTIEPIPPLATCQINNSCCAYVPGACGIVGGCPDGQRQYTKTCGSNGPVSDCGYLDLTNVFFPGGTDFSCVFACQTPPNKLTTPTLGYGNLCLNDEMQLTNNTTHYSYVDEGGCSATKCEIECASPFVSYTDYCDCPSGTEWDGNDCVSTDHFDGWGHSWQSLSALRSKEAALEACQVWFADNYPGHECQCGYVTTSYAALVRNCHLGGSPGGTGTGQTCCDRDWELNVMWNSVTPIWWYDTNAFCNAWPGATWQNVGSCFTAPKVDWW